MVQVQTKVDTEAVVWFVFKAKVQLPSVLIFNGINSIVNDRSLGLSTHSKGAQQFLTPPYMIPYDPQQKDLQISSSLQHATLELQHRINAAKHQMISEPWSLGKAVALSLGVASPHWPCDAFPATSFSLCYLV